MGNENENMLVSPPKGLCSVDTKVWYLDQYKDSGVKRQEDKAAEGENFSTPAYGLFV